MPDKSIVAVVLCLQAVLVLLAILPAAFSHI